MTGVRQHVTYRTEMFLCDAPVFPPFAESGAETNTLYFKTTGWLFNGTKTDRNSLTYILLRN